MVYVFLFLTENTDVYYFLGTTKPIKPFEIAANCLGINARTRCSKPIMAAEGVPDRIFSLETFENA